MAYVTLTTDAKSFHQSETITTSATTAPVKRVTATKPATSLTVSTVVGSSLNYLKIKSFSSSTSIVPSFYVFGWNYVVDTNSYVPQLLAYVVGTLDAAGATTIPGIGSVTEVTSYTLSQGDAKIYNGTTTTSAGGFLLVDTLGCEFIEIVPVNASGSASYTFLTAGV